MDFLTIVALIIAVLTWDGIRKIAKRREDGRAARAAYYQSELDRLRRKRDAEDAHERMMRSTQRLAEEAASKRFE